MPTSFDSQYSRYDVYNIASDWPQPAPDPRTLPRPRRRALTPGNYYLLGNLLGLGAGIGFSIAHSASQAGARAETAVGAVGHYLVGSASATMMTLAMLIFLGSCVFYDRAFRTFPTPDLRLTRLADGVSCIGAIALGIGLLVLGEPLLALSSGLLHAWGKFGSATRKPGSTGLPGWPATWPDFYRTIVFASRFPAILAALLDFNGSLGARGHWTELAAPVVLLACYAVWAKADLLLFAAEQKR